ncbi:glycosyltransferase [Maribellus comscasis]|uniref:Glycosyltransferase n=1 Tax=Maribellus comscasis TaxID=2681766 RepID=A0A6I6JTN0_9BACT|nr:glycosyltransferase [Maribellus comscasis]QGY44448.1 glycosyltransferase [Maribellus comscasis]
MKFTIIVPVYNRLEEVKELLESAENIDFNRSEFEFLFVDDGSNDGFNEFISSYQSPSKLKLRAIFQQNQGPANARNNGMANCDGDFMLFIDSDCMLPPQWLKEIDKGIAEFGFDAFGGPDTFHPSFSPLLKAINYSMTSFIGTGGIRGNKKSVEKFYPRSFNMGISRAVYEKIGGMRLRYYGEDTDFSARIDESGFKMGLIPDAFVYHKRRTSLTKFFKQIKTIGMARIKLGTMHKNMLKVIHLLPAILILGLLLLVIVTPFLLTFTGYLWSLVGIGFLGICLLAFFQSFRMYKSIKPALLSIVTLNIQVFAYGVGLLQGIFKFIILKKD